MEVLLQLGLKFHGDSLELEERIKDILREEREATRFKEVIEQPEASEDEQ